MRPIQATINIEAFRHNLNVVKLHAKTSKVMAVIKANAYGHGLLHAASGLKLANGFAVLGLDEAVSLRNAGYQHTILLLEGIFSIEEFELVSRLRISIVVHSENQLSMLESVRNLVSPLEVFLKMNSGMNRLGFEPHVFSDMHHRLVKCGKVHNVVLMTHFATADDHRGIQTSLDLFNKYSNDLNCEKSLANSATILKFPVAHQDWVRPGIMLYGASPVSEIEASKFNLKPVMTLSSQVIALQDLKIGDRLGYGYTFSAERRMRIGVVACGYADGYPRHAPTGTPILVSGKLTRTLGRVSMDMLYVDLSEIPDAGIGSYVELWGETVPVDEIAKASGTIGYELLCALAQRVPLKVING